MTFPVPNVSDVEIAFPVEVSWIPPADKLPKLDQGSKQHRFFLDLFYAVNGNVLVKTLGMLPQKGVDPAMAWRALQVVLGTFGIPHEHKTAAFAYLCAEWFVDIRWQTAKGTIVTFDDKELDLLWCAKQIRDAQKKKVP